MATSDGNIDGAIFLRTIKASGSDKVWGPWVSLYNTANFNPDSKLNYNGFNGDLNTIDTSGLYRLGSGCTNTPNSGSATGCHILHTKWGHYIEITIDFENNEYQAINNTINGSISVNTSGTSN